MCLSTTFPLCVGGDVMESVLCWFHSCSPRLPAASSVAAREFLEHVENPRDYFHVLIPRLSVTMLLVLLFSAVVHAFSPPTCGTVQLFESLLRGGGSSTVQPGDVVPRAREYWQRSGRAVHQGGCELLHLAE